MTDNRHRERSQIGVSLSAEHRAIIKRMADYEGRSISGLAADVLVPYLDAWAAQQKAKKKAVGIFDRVAKGA